MSIEQPADQEVDLDAFTTEFFGENKVVPPAKAEHEDADEDADDDAPEETIEDKDALADEDEADDEDEDEEPEPKPKENRTQKRISELVKRASEAERRESATNARMAELEARLEQDKPKPQARTVFDDTAPTPNDLTADGTDKYPLGEFDPQYIVDLTKHTLVKERENFDRDTATKKSEQEFKANRAALADSWNEKLDPARERYPDFQDKAQSLIDSFNGIDASYSDYLTTTIMSLEYGTDVLYYLANHPAEAKKIVANGPQKATVALGRIEAQFVTEEEDKSKIRPKVSKAPIPPARLNKGTTSARRDTPPDTDDLDAFAAKFFKRRG